MDNGRPRHESRATVDELAKSLARRDRQAGIHLAHLFLADESDEGGAYRLFACALARQLRHWPKGIQAIGEDDLIRMFRTAARELLAEHRE